MIRRILRQNIAAASSKVDESPGISNLPAANTATPAQLAVLLRGKRRL